MVNSAFNFCFGSRNFTFERRDALVQFVDRQRIEILHRQLAEEVVLATRKFFVGVHLGSNVDRGGHDVNKAAGFYGARK